MKIDATHIKNIEGKLSLSGSKSESNRALILKQFLPGLQIENLSHADDTRLLQKALAQVKGTVDIGPAGTAMRFLTAYYAVTEGADVVLTGSTRMQERPIGILVKALRSLGADISYTGQEGYPPLRIRGKKCPGNKVRLEAGVSSQYLSALLLVAPFLPKGLQLELEGEITSLPYLEMTLEILRFVGCEVSFSARALTVQPYKGNKDKPQLLAIESDWSSASYYYSLLALSAPGSSLKLTTFFQNSLQGDSRLVRLYRTFGVHTEFLSDEKAILLTKMADLSPISALHWDLKSTPDIAQTLAVTCAGLGWPVHLTGLHTLKIKETDRLQALKTELEKLGALVQIDSESLRLQPCKKLNPDVTIATYHDHRMAMAFAPLALKVPLQIENPYVVSKSYPAFWEDWAQLLK